MRRTSRQANVIWGKINGGSEFPTPLPCPCCGSVDLYTGHLCSDELGVKCKGCGLLLASSWPDRVTNKMAKEMKDIIEGISQVCLWISIEDWNKRA